MTIKITAKCPACDEQRLEQYENGFRCGACKTESDQNGYVRFSDLPVGTVFSLVDKPSYGRCAKTTRAPFVNNAISEHGKKPIRVVSNARCEVVHGAGSVIEAIENNGGLLECGDDYD